MSQRELPPEWESPLLGLFERAFNYTQSADRAWFGTHPDAVSLVVGGIFLAACHHKRQEWVVSILADQDPPAVEGVNYEPVKSTSSSPYPLLWADTTSLTGVRALIVSDAFWASYAAATVKILAAPVVAADRDDVQHRRGKHRLSEFLSSPPVGVFPDEVRSAASLTEGAVCQVTVNAYERNPKARRQCLAAHGTACCICGFSFGVVYGPEAEGFVHVHHVRPLSEIGGEYVVNPVEDLRPVCPNCHAVLHLGGQCRTIDAVRELIGRQRHAEPV